MFEQCLDEMNDVVGEQKMDLMTKAPALATSSADDEPEGLCCFDAFRMNPTVKRSESHGLLPSNHMTDHNVAG